MAKRCAAAAVLQHMKQFIIDKIADCFAWWAEIVFDNPYRCIAATVAVTLVCCIGFIPGIPQWIDGADALYSLPFSVARSEGAVHRVLFNETNSRPTFILISGKTPGENIFTWKHLEDVKQLDKLIRGQIVDPKHRRRIGISHKAEYDLEEKKKIKVVPNPHSQLRASLNASNATVGSRTNGDHHVPHEAHHSMQEMNNGSQEQKHVANSRNILDRGDAGHDILTFQDICVRGPFGTCSVSGIQEMGVFDLMRDIFLKPGEDPTLFLLDGLVFNSQKKAFPPHYFLGKANEVSCSPELPRSMLSLYYTEDELVPGSSPAMARANMTCITHAEAFLIIYEIFDSPAYQIRNEDWERVLVDVLSDNMEFGRLKITMNAFRSRDDALRSSTSESSDILYVGLTFGFLLAYSTGLNFSCDLYRSKAYPALAGLIAAILGLIAGMGSISLCGIAFVPTALVCPFLVVGVGTDDMFVIINGYSMTYMVDSAKYRCILSLKDTGLSITITTLTSLVSFMIGLNTGYLSIRNFCWFCGAGMFFGYVFVLTFFFAVHCLDAKREEENRACLFCVPHGRREARREELRMEGVAFQKGADITIFTLGALMCRRAEQNALRRHAYRCQLKDLSLTSAGPITAATEPGGKELSVSSSTHPASWKVTLMTPNTSESVVADDNDEDTGERPSKKKGGGLRLPILQPSARTGLSGIYDKAAHKLQTVSDALLTRVALEAHTAGIRNNVDASPSKGVLNFSKLDKEMPSTGNPLTDILNYPFVPLHYVSELSGERKLFLEEPKGNVGLKWHQFFIRHYGPLLVHPISKIVVFVAFGIFMAVSLMGCLQLESGLDLKDLAPIGSYLNKFDLAQATFFDQYDFPVDVFFPKVHEWWLPTTQKSMRELEKIMQESGSGKLVTNPFIRMLDDPELRPHLQSGNREIFEATLFNAVSADGSKYKQFEQNFVWEGTHLRAWKMQILPGPMLTSAERASWMTQIRADCQGQLEADYPLVVMAWNYMMTFYESDLQINSSVTSNMIVAAITMLIIATVAIPQLKAGFLVTLIMGMIDIGIIGFMFFWGVKLNMVSMICLLIAVGFSVDFSAHVCHTYMDAEGETRNQRAIETLVIMGNPVFHGATSSILGILMLGFSESYIFRVFFKMMIMVTVFALMHSIIFLPVLLSVVSGSRPHSAHKTAAQSHLLKKGSKNSNRAQLRYPVLSTKSVNKIFQGSVAAHASATESAESTSSPSVSSSSSSSSSSQQLSSSHVAADSSQDNISYSRPCADYRTHKPRRSTRYGQRKQSPSKSTVAGCHISETRPTFRSPSIPPRYHHREFNRHGVSSRHCEAGVLRDGRKRGDRQWRSPLKNSLASRNPNKKMVVYQEDKTTMCLETDRRNYVGGSRFHKAGDRRKQLVKQAPVEWRVLGHPPAGAGVQKRSVQETRHKTPRRRSHTTQDDWSDERHLSTTLSSSEESGNDENSRHASHHLTLRSKEPRRRKSSLKPPHRAHRNEHRICEHKVADGNVSKVNGMRRKPRRVTMQQSDRDVDRYNTSCYESEEKSDSYNRSKTLYHHHNNKYGVPARPHHAAGLSELVSPDRRWLSPAIRRSRAGSSSNRDGVPCIISKRERERHLSVRSQHNNIAVVGIVNNNTSDKAVSGAIELHPI